MRFQHLEIALFNLRASFLPRLRARFIALSGRFADAHSRIPRHRWLAAYAAKQRKQHQQ